MNEFEKALRQVSEGAKWSIDFKLKVAYVNGKPLNKDGDYGLFADTTSLNVTFLEALFNEYYHSVPDERSERRIRNYFKALPYEELSDEDLMYRMQRNVAQFVLELTFLRLVIEKKIVWEELTNANHWFWQSEKYPQFVILREWVE